MPFSPSLAFGSGSATSATSPGSRIHRGQVRCRTRRIGSASGTRATTRTDTCGPAKRRYGAEISPLAARAFEEALSILPSAAAHAGLARVRAALGRFEDARAHFRAALDETPNDVDVLAGYALVLDALGQAVRADSVLTRAVLIAPENLSVLRHRADLLARLGSVDASIAAYEALLARVPDDTDALEALATQYDGAGRPHDAVRAWSRLTTLRDWDPVAKWRLGVALARTDEVDGARGALTDALELAGDGATADSIRAELARLESR